MLETEQKELEAETLRLFLAVNQQIERIGTIIREMRELIKKGGETNDNSTRGN
jgi:hypothetical protein